MTARLGIRRSGYVPFFSLYAAIQLVLWTKKELSSWV